MTYQRNKRHAPPAAEADHNALALVSRISHSLRSGDSRLSQMLEQIIRLTQDTLNANASSVLLFGDQGDDLYFAATSGPVDEALRKVRISSRSGIAGQVLQSGQPRIVNDVSRNMDFDRDIDATTGFTTKSLVCAPLVVGGRNLGVIEVLNKRDGSRFNDHDLNTVVTVANEAAMAIENTRLHETVLEAYKATIQTLAAAIDAKDPYTRGHSTRVMEYAVGAGAALALAPEQLETLEYAGILHDVGKIAIDSTILGKPEKLTDEEWHKVREHPRIGANIIREVPFLKDAAELVLCHHERYDGSGYPQGLKGEDIPLGARVLAVADSFDSMTTDRSYHKASSVEEALGELVNCSGTQFCPVAVEAFISSFPAQA
jgi:HD-GYP domain-containing protein (c-di-GMP phosphodiesterase class II)